MLGRCFGCGAAIVVPKLFCEWYWRRLTPGQALLLPAPDSKAPDDLFLGEVPTRGKMPEDIPGADEELLEVWDRVKGKISQLDIQDTQIAKWFWSRYQVEVGLHDFDTPIPPKKLSAEKLSHFLESVERYEAGC